jgi:peptidoglycan-N-acetylglucosamine deacetylase
MLSRTLKSGIKAALQRGLTPKNFVWKGPFSRPEIALTFDDGPDPVHTPDVLRILEKYGAAATFFLIGRHAEHQPALVRQIHAGGHQLGIHTYSHPRLFQLPYRQVKEELERTRDILAEPTGMRVGIYRPPRGELNARLLAYTMYLGFTTVLWNVTFSDYKKIDSRFITSQIPPGGFQPGSIILLHDNNPFTVEALPTLLETLRTQGIRSVTLDTLLS